MKGGYKNKITKYKAMCSYLVGLLQYLCNVSETVWVRASMLEEVTSAGRIDGSSTPSVSGCGCSALWSTEHAAPTAAATGPPAPAAGPAGRPRPEIDWAHGSKVSAEPWTWTVSTNESLILNLLKNNSADIVSLEHVASQYARMQTSQVKGLLAPSYIH